MCVCVCAGVLEWCEGTIPFGAWLVLDGTKLTAHDRYRPRDWKSATCRKRLMGMNIFILVASRVFACVLVHFQAYELEHARMAMCCIVCLSSFFLSFFLHMLSWIVCLDAAPYTTSEERAQPNSKYQVYEEVCANFQPVFRYFPFCFFFSATFFS